MSSELEEARPPDMRFEPQDHDMFVIKADFKDDLWSLRVTPAPAFLGERVARAVEATCDMLEETLNGRDGQAAYLYARLPNWRCEWTEQKTTGGLGWVATYKGETPKEVPYVVEIANATLVDFAGVCLHLEHQVADEFREEAASERAHEV